MIQPVQLPIKSRKLYRVSRLTNFIFLLAAPFVIIFSILAFLGLPGWIVMLAYIPAAIAVLSIANGPIIGRYRIFYVIHMLLYLLTSFWAISAIDNVLVQISVGGFNVLFIGTAAFGHYLNVKTPA